ncbi:MAG: RdgB/HAM1 family non-canonical purine NTP pyrophosphatase [Pseudomonadota bacterium]
MPVELGKRLLVASHNAGKIEEMRAILAPRGITVVSAGEMGLPEPAETETTFEGNARIKAHAAAAATGLPALSDDSGLAVDALNGAPGVYTADWAETPMGRDFTMAMHRLHAALRETLASPPFSARFVSVLCLAEPDGSDSLFCGSVEGEIVWPMRGALGHGFDPVFIPTGWCETFAEMAPEEKNRISHRAVSLRLFLETCFPDPL